MPADAVTWHVGLHQEGREAATALREALVSMGITLPTVVGDYPVNGKPFVRLGGVSAEEATAIAKRLRELRAIEENWQIQATRKPEERA